VGGGASTHLHLVNSKEELLHYYSELIVDKCEPIIQEYIPGSSEQMYMINVLYSKDNELLAYFMAKKVREYPPGGGITCCGVSIYEPALLEFAKKMFHELNWYGVAEIEFKLDTRDKQFKLIEINPRFWQYLKLPIYCGVDFPYLLYRTANGYEVEEVAEYKKDVHYINVVKDIPSISKSLLVSENKSEYLLSVINSYKGDKTYSSKIGIESILWRV
jgi:predicted ATP-grasp superfamily ATP-dependent carboligase